MSAHSRYFAGLHPSVRAFRKTTIWSVSLLCLLGNRDVRQERLCVSRRRHVKTPTAIMSLRNADVRRINQYLIVRSYQRKPPLRFGELGGPCSRPRLHKAQSWLLIVQRCNQNSMTAFEGTTFFLSKSGRGPDSTREGETPRLQWRRTSESENEPLFPPEHHTARRASLPDASFSDFVNRLEITRISLMGLAATVEQSTSERMQPNEKITSSTRLGFIGLGYLGSRIARRLIAAGFPAIVYDRDHTKAAEFSALGAGAAPDVATLARDVDIVLSCLPDAVAVEEVYLGTGKVLGAAGRFTTIIELSTVAPETARRLHEAGASLGISVLDVAISGSILAAESGTLTLFGGGDVQTFEAAQPIFRAIAAQWFHMGASGSGVAMKLVVNTLLGLGMQAIAEAVALGAGLGLPRDLLFDTLAKTAVVAQAHAGKLASARRDDYTPQFPVRLMRKDFGLILTEIGRAHV